MAIYAGIDLGTLTIRLLIASISEAPAVARNSREGACLGKSGAGGVRLSSGVQRVELKELASERRIARLGEGLQHRRLQPAAMSRIIDAIHGWMPLIERAGVRHVVTVATSAVRDAVNREEFVSLVRRQTGLEVEVIGGEEEARRTVLGIAAGLPIAVNEYLALDIGGGSTEFISVSSGAPALMHSIDEGVVRLTEECFRHDPATAEEVTAARGRVRRHLSRVPMVKAQTDRQLVGTAGSITTLAAMDQQLETYAPQRIHNYRLSLDAVRRLTQDLTRRTLAERRALPGLEGGREDVIFAGAMILEEIMERFGFLDCLVSDYGLREGIVIDAWQKTRFSAFL